MSDIKSAKQTDKSTKQNVFQKAKYFFKGYKTPKYLILSSITFLTLTLILSALALWSSNTTKQIAKASATDLIANVSLGYQPQLPKLSPDESKIYIANFNDPGKIDVFNTVSNTITNTITVGNSPWSTTFNPTGTTAYVSNYNTAVPQDPLGGSISVIDVATSTETLKIPLGAGRTPTFSFLAGTKLYVLDGNTTVPNNLSVIDTATNTVSSTIGVGGYQNKAVLSADGAFLYVLSSSGSSQDLITKINTSTGSTQSINIPLGGTCGCLSNMVLSPDGSKLYVSLPLADKMIAINTVSMSAPDANNTVTFPAGSSPTFIKIPPDGSKLYVENSGSRTISVINTGILPLTVTSTINTGGAGKNMELSADGSLIYVTNDSNNTFSTIDTLTGQIVKTVSTGNTPFYLLLSEVNKRVYGFNIGSVSLSKSIDIFALNIVTSSDITSASCTPNINDISGTANCTVNTSNSVTGFVTFTLGTNAGLFGKYCDATFPVSGGNTANCSITFAQTGLNTPVMATASGGGVFSAGNLTINPKITTPNLGSGATSGGTNISIAGSGFQNFYEGMTVKNINPGIGDPSNRIDDQVFQADGKSLIISPTLDTTVYNNIPINALYRLDQNLNLDTAFSSNLNASLVTEVSSVAIQPDQKILVSRVVSSYSPPPPYILRLNSDGTTDNTFNQNTLTNKVKFRGITIQPDAVGNDFKILVTTSPDYTDTSNYKITRLNSDGSLDNSFSSNVLFPTNKIIGTLVQNDRKILVYGTFTSLNGTTSNKLIRLNPNGDIDATFNNGFDSTAKINSIAYQKNDDKILVGGEFTTYNGNTVGKNIIRLNSDGSVDTSFVTGTGAFSPGTSTDSVGIIKIQPSTNKILLVGPRLYNGSYPGNNSSIGFVIRLNSDGTLDNSFIYDYSPSGTTSGPETLEIDPFNNIWVYGYSNRYDNFPRKLNNTTTLAKVELIQGATTLTCTNTVVVSSSSITCTTPATVTSGQYDVKITNGDGTSTTLTNGYTYFSPTVEISSSSITSLQSCNPTYPTPVVQGVGTVTCILKLTDNLAANYILPTIPLVFKIDNSTASISCSAASGASCSIDNTADTITITAVPTTGSSLGSQPLSVSGDGTNFTSYNNAAFVVRNIVNGDIASLVCATPKFINETTNCTITTTTDVANLTGTIKVRVGAGGTSVPCNVSAGTGTTIPCNNVSVGVTAGTFPSQYATSGTIPETYVDGNNITVVVPTTTITQANIATSSNCTSTLTVTIGSTYSCVFPLAGDPGNNYTLPAGGITASTSSASGSSPACTNIAGNGTGNVALVCSSIPTTAGSTGLQNVLVTIGGGTATDKGDVTLTNYVTTDLLFIDPSKVSFSPVESSAIKFGSGDLTLTVNPNTGSGATGDTRLTRGGTTAVCKFRLKEFGVADSDATRGFDASLSKLAGSVADLDLTNNSFDVAYSETTGCSVKLPAGTAQNQPKWFFETRVVRSDTQVFGRDNSYFMTYGAIGGVSVS
ncbi:MAG: hypothetical protein WCK98_06015 [bacterium]